MLQSAKTYNQSVLDNSDRVIKILCPGMRMFLQRQKEFFTYRKGQSLVHDEVFPRTHFFGVKVRKYKLLYWWVRNLAIDMVSQSPFRREMKCIPKPGHSLRSAVPSTISMLQDGALFFFSLQSKRISFQQCHCSTQMHTNGNLAMQLHASFE